MSVEVESEDVIRLVLQFLKESQLTRTASTLESETSVKINTVESKDRFIKEITAGEWDHVLRQVTDLKMAPRKLMDLYEQVILELIELRELGAARTLLRQTEPMFVLKQRYPERYLRLEHTLSRTVVDPKDIYPNGQSKEKRRQVIGQALANEVTVVEPSRLMTLLEDAIKWQQHQGLIKPDTEVDLFRRADQVLQIEEDTFAKHKYATIKFPGKNTYAECTAFAPNGQYLVTGSVDGFIEVWNYLTGKLRKDLKYQAEENLMAMDESVICLAFSEDSELLASGSTDGKIAIWKIQAGHCQRRFSPAHSQGVTSMRFNKDGTQLLSSSYDHTIKIHGIRTGKLMKSFKGHKAFVNAVVYLDNNTKIASASSDGEVKIWDTQTESCLYSLQPQGKLPIHTLLNIPNQGKHFMVISKAKTLMVLDLEGKLQKSIGYDKAKTDIITAVVSHQGKLCYAVTEDATLYCLDMVTGGLKGEVSVCQSEVIGISAHPFSNVVAASDETGNIYLLKA
ncbi:WD40 repeat-like protein [Backusella circina FSU 941]|nr:WD40 repeat-like protein [Backusella circina FSU 941]